ncbi:hypothetical protein ACHAPT_007999 [Fusarium lateritium]
MALEPHNALLRALLDQLVNQNTALSSKLFIKYLNAHAEEIRETDTLQELVKQAIAKCHITFLVLDGLDEVAKNETVQTVEWLLSMVKDDHHGRVLKVMISTRGMGTHLRSLLNVHSSISLSKGLAHAEDMRLYCTKYGREIQERFGLADGTWEEIAETVTGGPKRKQ